MSALRFAVEPRDVPAVKAARRLHLTEAEFRCTLPDLLTRGFPEPDPTTGMFDLKAIDVWMDRRSGLSDLTANPSARDAKNVVGDRLARMRGG